MEYHCDKSITPLELVRRQSLSINYILRYLWQYLDLCPGSDIVFCERMLFLLLYVKLLYQISDVFQLSMLLKGGYL